MNFFNFDSLCMFGFYSCRFLASMLPALGLCLRRGPAGPVCAVGLSAPQLG